MYDVALLGMDPQGRSGNGGGCRGGAGVTVGGGSIGRGVMLTS